MPPQPTHDDRIVFAIRLLCLLTLLALVQSSALGRSAPADCNAPAEKPVDFTFLPGTPFGVAVSSDGCWVFAALTEVSGQVMRGTPMPSQSGGGGGGRGFGGGGSRGMGGGGPMGISGPSGNGGTHGIAVLERSQGRLKVKRVVGLHEPPQGIVLTHDGKMLIAASGDLVYFLDVKKMLSGKHDPIVGVVKAANHAGSSYVNVTPDDRFLFISNSGTRNITVVNLAKMRSKGFSAAGYVGSIPTGSAPAGLTISPDQKWLYNTTSFAPPDWKWPDVCKARGFSHPQGAIEVIDLAKAETDSADSVVARVPAGCEPASLALSPSGSEAWVTARADNKVLEFDTTKLRTDPSHAEMASMPAGASPVGIAAVDDGKDIIATNSARLDMNRTAPQSLTVIAADRAGQGQAAVEGTIQAGIFPREITLSPDGKTAFVTNFFSRSIETIDLSKLSAVLEH